MTITSTPRWSLGRGNAVVPSRWQATGGCTAGKYSNANPRSSPGAARTCHLTWQDAERDLFAVIWGSRGEGEVKMRGHPLTWERDSGVSPSCSAPATATSA